MCGACVGGIAGASSMAQIPSRVAAFVAISALYEVVGPRVLSAGPGMIELAKKELAARRALFLAPTGRAPARKRVATNGPFGAVQRMVDRVNEELGHTV